MDPWKASPVLIRKQEKIDNLVKIQNWYCLRRQIKKQVKQRFYKCLTQPWRFEQFEFLSKIFQKFEFPNSSIKVSRKSLSSRNKNLDKSPKNNTKNLRTPWPSGGRQKGTLYGSRTPLSCEKANRWELFQWLDLIYTEQQTSINALHYIGSETRESTTLPPHHPKIIAKKNPLVRITFCECGVVCVNCDWHW